MSKKLRRESHERKFSPYITEDSRIAMQNALTEMINGYSNAIIASIIEFRHQSKIGNSMYCDQLQRNIDHYHTMRTIAKKDLEMLRKNVARMPEKLDDKLYGKKASARIIEEIN